MRAAASASPRASRPQPGLTALFGRSGSGKTTLVDIVGGLIRPDRGRVAVDGQVLVDTERGVFVPKHRRRIGYVFQDSRLFPHLSVRSNLLYGRWFAREPGGAAADLASVVELLGIGPLLERRPDLAVGRREAAGRDRPRPARPSAAAADGRAAGLARRGAARPRSCPTSSGCATRAGVPILYVSHSVAEVARLATTVVILTDGKVTAVGPVADILPLADAATAAACSMPRWRATTRRSSSPSSTSAAGELQVPRLSAPAARRCAPISAPATSCCRCSRPRRSAR